MRDAQAFDVERVDGPHRSELTAVAAHLIPAAVRYLNYATMPADGAPGISYAGDADNVLGSIASAVGGLQQTFDQVETYLRKELATGRLRVDAGRPHADDPAKAVEAACADLEVAANDCATLQATLAKVRRITAGMYREDSDGGA